MNGKLLKGIARCVWGFVFQCVEKWALISLQLADLLGNYLIVGSIQFKCTICVWA